MEAFSLLKYWRTSGGTTALFTGDSTFSSRATTKTTATPYYSDYGEDGPYFDLEFTLTDETGAAKSLENEDPSEKTETESGSLSEESSDNENGDDEDEELKYISLTNDDIAYQNMTLSPSDELFFNGHLVPIEPSNKSPVSLLKSAANFRVLLLKLKKAKSSNGVLEKAEKSEANEDKSVSGKMFAVKFKVDEVKGPLFSLFARDNDSLKRSMQDSDTNTCTDERKLTKEVMQKYLKMLKPLYVRASSRYVEKMKFSGPVNFRGGGGGSVSLSCKHLGKSRSTSATTSAPPGMTGSNRRDDSLLQLQDGIQGAILHCKKSFNASRDGESAMLSRSVSDPSQEKSVIMATV
ncbi:hypothetical protein CDL12_28220 [Handroanthus impetiginosus]|uniref:Membrane-associated kinase regulator 2 n=1 Tax=Handroanthus impetiginosus TaxID=429701 RepID=A0A2G9G1T7_9LAMI|nr:hypothetical protein CDL12_28220 [Handroanthus impetiginosus]